MSNELKASQVKKLLLSTGNLSILITGQPAIGKSSVILQAIEEAGVDFIRWDLISKDVTDFAGIPFKNGETCEFLPFGDIVKLQNITKPTWVILEDIGWARDEVQLAIRSLLHEGKINGVKIKRDLIKYVATTNRRMDKAGVKGLQEPVKSVFAAIVEMKADLDDFCKYAIEAKLPDVLVRFIRQFPELLHEWKPSLDLVNQVSPRTLEACGRLIQANLEKDLRLPAYAGAIGEGAAIQLISFMASDKSMPSVDAILANPNAGNIPLEPSTLWVLAQSLSVRATKENFKNVLVYAYRMHESKHGEFAMLLIKTAIEKNPKLQETMAFQNLLLTDLGKSIVG